MTAKPTSFNLWPYDELRLSCGPALHEFQLEAPWVRLQIRASEDEADRLRPLADKFQAQALAPTDIGELNWLLRSFLQFPIAYYLPRTASGALGPDRHALRDASLAGVTPGEFLARTVPDHLDAAKTAEFEGWSWPQADALSFSQVSPGLYDPFSLFSLARRFSLVEAAQFSHTQALFERMEHLKGDPARHRDACARIVRQNHYVTEKCNPSLLPALETAQGARDAVNAFIRAELGHDKLLARAVESFGRTPESIEVVPATRALMALLKLSGERNFLAFALAVDIFERTDYSERDPLAALLDSAGLGHAAKQIDIHKGINDSGAHENVALSFLDHMAPVDEAYATEALRFAEMISYLVQTISRDLLESLAPGQ